MLSPSIQKYFKESFPSRIGKSISSLTFSSVGGGSINQTLRATVNKNEHFFCKINSVAKFPGLFRKERNGLEKLSSVKLIKVPGVIDLFEEDDQQLLVIEWIDEGVRNEKFWSSFGQQLASLHKITSEQFGYTEDNYMGSLVQFNAQKSDWTDFFIQQRLELQIQLAMDNGLLEKKTIEEFNSLYKILPRIFLPEPPALVHGDLWSGNFLCDSKSNPVLIDPAVYYGSRHMDLAMTTLFGSFHRKFYEEYDQYYSLPVNHKEQWDTCNLYPLLIHLNLFGKGYLHSITEILSRLLLG